MPVQPDVTAVILCGGRSSRMGRDKSWIEFEGTTLVQRTVTAASEVASEVVLVRARGQSLPGVLAPCPVVTVEDALEGEGPLFGMATGLAVARGDLCLLLGVDMPLLKPALLLLLVDRLRSARAAEGTRWLLPVADRRPQPLCSAMARDALPVLRAHLDAGDRAPMSAASDLRMARLGEDEWGEADPDGQSFVDVDTPEALDAARRLSDNRPGTSSSDRPI